MSELVCEKCGGPVSVEGRTTHYYWCDACECAVDVKEVAR